MSRLVAPALAAVIALLPGTARAADNPHPKGNDTGCCLSFDRSPVQVFFCSTADACRIEPPK